MKYILIILSLFLFASCDRYHEKVSNVNGYIAEKDFKEAYSKFEYHYGWSMMKGEFCWHWGNNNHSAKYSTTIVVEKRKINLTSKQTFDSYQVNDSVKMTRHIRIRDKDSTVIDTTYYLQ